MYKYGSESQEHITLINLGRINDTNKLYFQRRKRKNEFIKW